MTRKEQMKKITRETTMIRLERNLYIISSVLFLSTTIINILNIIYYPYLLNGIILELNILMICLCTYLFIKKQEKLNNLEDEKIELKIKCFLEK